MYVLWIVQHDRFQLRTFLFRILSLKVRENHTKDGIFEWFNFFNLSIPVQLYTLGSVKT